MRNASSPRRRGRPLQATEVAVVHLVVIAIRLGSVAPRVDFHGYSIENLGRVCLHSDHVTRARSFPTWAIPPAAARKYLGKNVHCCLLGFGSASGEWKY